MLTLNPSFSSTFIFRKSKVNSFSDGNLKSWSLLLRNCSVHSVHVDFGSGSPPN